MAPMRPGGVLLLVSALGAGCALPRPYGEGVTLHTLVSGGYRALADDFDDHAAYGLELATRERESGWGYELGGTYGADEESGPREPSLEFDELYLGLRRSWRSDWGSVHLGFGGALTRIELTLHSPRAELEEDGGGAYLHGGVLWRLGELTFERGTEVLIGLDLRGLEGEDHDYTQLALVLGFGR